MLQSKKSFKLGGENREIAILFSDIRGFTTFSEGKDPHELLSILNVYLDKLTKVVLAHKGLLDKFIGDAIMAFWGSPLEDKDKENDICHCAIAMVNALEEINKTQKQKLKMGIGIHSGIAVVGNVGSEDRFDYTAIGDNVNLTSRLEGLSKYYAVDIVASENIVKKAKGFTFKILDIVQVKGKTEPVKIYELLTEKRDIKDFEKAFAYYLDAKWEKAKEYFEKSKDPSAPIFLERIETLKHMKEKSWDGIFRHTTK